MINRDLSVLSIVIITFNSRNHIQACLDAVFSQAVEELEVVTVDNASLDGTALFIKDNFKQVILIENSINLGASKARNQGIERTSGKWILSLDSDVVLGRGFITEFFSILQRLPDTVGMLQPNILDQDGATVYSQGICLTWLRRFYDLNRGQSVAVARDCSNRIIGPCSAAGFYKRSMLEQIKEPTGYFDERFFFLVEDVDLAWRARKAAWAVRYSQQMKCRHIGNGSGTDQHTRQWLSFRNRHWMIAKNANSWEAIWLGVIAWPYECLRMIYCGLFNPVFRQSFLSGLAKKITDK